MKNSLVGKKVTHFRFSKRVLDSDMPFVQVAIDRCHPRNECKKAFGALIMFDKNQNKPISDLKIESGLTIFKLNHCINELVSNGLIEVSQRRK